MTGLQQWQPMWTRWARFLGNSRYQFPFDEDDENNATEEARMDSQSQRLSMRTKQELQQLWMNLLLKTQLHAPMTPAVQQPLLPSTPLITPRPPTPTMSQTREQPVDLQPRMSPPTLDIRNSSLQRHSLFSLHAKEQTPCKVPATQISPFHQSVFSSVREQTPMSETRENPVPDNVPFDHPAKWPILPASPPPTMSPRRFNRIHTAPQRLGYDNTQGHGYYASPSAWIFEEHGIILSPTAF